MRERLMIDVKNNSGVHMSTLWRWIFFTCAAHCVVACATVNQSTALAPSGNSGASVNSVAKSATPVATEVAPPVVRPPALWDGSAVTWEELRPLLAERAGASVLEELFLERQLDQMLKARKLNVTAELLQTEERELVASLSDDPARAIVLLSELRAAQGLGEKRWKSLLKRNSAMRLLVQNDVKVTPDAVEALMDAAHGPKRQCRVMALPNLKMCAEARARLDAGEPFGEVAADLSTDRSASRGGLVLPVSRLDPTWPSSFRQTLWSLQKDGVSAPVLIDNGYVFIRFENEIPGDVTTSPDTRAVAERAVRRGQERIYMENLAKQLRQAQRNVTIFDDSLLDGWTRVRNVAR